MAGLAGVKLSFSDLKKITAEVFQDRIEPKTVETKIQADMFNKRDKLMARLLGLHVIHEWKPGDRYYELPIKAKAEEAPLDSFTQGLVGMGQEGPEEVDTDIKKGKPIRKKSKNVPKVDGKTKRKRTSKNKSAQGV
jgi:hypothetical protein